MRTTLEIDDDILQVARTLAAAEGTNVGRMLSDLARSGLELQGRPTHFPVFDVVADAPRITLDDVNDALEGE
jgi:hypothetical protein